jgi:hypothetical protein
MRPTRATPLATEMAVQPSSRAPCQTDKQEALLSEMHSPACLAVAPTEEGQQARTITCYSLLGGAEGHLDVNVVQAGRKSPETRATPRCDHA